MPFGNVCLLDAYHACRRDMCKPRIIYKSHFEVRSLLLLQNPKMSKHDRCPSPVGEPPPANCKRPDVAAKKAANKLLVIAVVKSILSSFRTEEGKHLGWSFYRSQQDNHRGIFIR